MRIALVVLNLLAAVLLLNVSSTAAEQKDKGDWERVEDWGVEPDDHIVERAKNAPVDPRHFSLNKDLYSSGYDTVRDEDKITKWSDISQALKISAINIAEALIVNFNHITGGSVNSEYLREAELTKRDILNEGHRASAPSSLVNKKSEGAFDVGITDWLIIHAALYAVPMLASILLMWILYRLLRMVAHWWSR